MSITLTTYSLGAYCDELEIQRFDGDIELQTLDEEPLMLRATGSGTTGNYFVDASNWFAQNWKNGWSAIAHAYVSASDAIVGTYMDFHLWLEEQYSEDYETVFDEQQVEVMSGGDVDIPVPVQNIILEYVQYCIQQNPLSYKECYIYSYNFLNTSQFSNYGIFKTVQEFIKQHAYTFTYAPNGIINNQWVLLVGIDRSLYDVNFIGTTTNGGFTNVYLEHNWTSMQNSSFPQNNQGIDYMAIKWPNGGTGTGKTINAALQAAGVSTTSWTAPMKNVQNTSSIGTSLNTVVFSGLEKNELVYVFSSLNAYKNYNAGRPQDYYLTESGIAGGTWTATDGSFIAGQDLTYYGQSYQTITTQTQSGWTAEQVLQLVELIMSGQGSSGSGSGSGSDTEIDFGILGRIGALIARLFSMIINAIVEVFDSVVSIIENVSEHLLQGTIFEFLSAFIGWLPDEIIALLSALFAVAVIFALVRLVREAF